MIMVMTNKHAAINGTSVPLSTIRSGSFGPTGDGAKMIGDGAKMIGDGTKMIGDGAVILVSFVNEGDGVVILKVMLLKLLKLVMNNY